MAIVILSAAMACTRSALREAPSSARLPLTRQRAAAAAAQESTPGAAMPTCSAPLLAARKAPRQRASACLKLPEIAWLDAPEEQDADAARCCSIANAFFCFCVVCGVV
jgi:hypothetical protein